MTGPTGPTKPSAQFLAQLAAPASDPAQAYDRLHPGVQRWVWEQGWDRLRTVQANAVGPVLAGHDVVIAAATASGKTEAAWLPICSRIADADDTEKARPGVKALYLGPLKALINDQHLRLESLGESTGIPVHRWHGDVAASHKQSVIRSPDGILLITPESLEALFVREGHRIASVLNSLQYIVVDELHSFMGTERGAQLQSLMHRVDLALRRRVPRAGLSATLADLSVAADFLRPGHGHQVQVVDNPGGDTAEIRLQLRGYLKAQPTVGGTRADRADSGDQAEELEGTIHTDDALGIGAHLFDTLRGRDNLVFANSRAFVEAYADILAKISEGRQVPNEFLPHHGNLSKEYREDVERRLRATDVPATAVCTSTLEMGIDIGTTDSVAQIGAPGSVAALRQRLGRSGRRNQPAVLRIYISETELGERTPPPDQLRAQLVQTIAMVDLMLREHWYEPPNTADLHLSTLAQQILSVIAQHGGATASQLYTSLCCTGPFVRIDQTQFADLLRSMGDHKLLTQASDGLLLHGETGDRIVNHYSFYSAFRTAEEYRLVARGRTLGSIPIDYPVLVGSLLIFAGRRWQVIDVDTRSRVIELSRSSGGRPPTFAGTGADVADLVRLRMRKLYESDRVPPYLNAPAQTLLEEARASYQQLRLADRHLVGWGDDTLLFTWRGDRILNTLAVALSDAGLKVGIEGVALTLRDVTRDQVLAVVQTLLEQPAPDAAELAATVANTELQKYDQYLSPALRAQGYAAHSLDVAGAWEALGSLYAQEQSLSISDLPLEAAGQQSAEGQQPRRWPQLGLTGFAVIDVETTGFSVQENHRVVELAIVHLNAAGAVTGRWSTLVQPGRNPGPGHVHGITVDDLFGAPYFAELVEWVSGLLADRVVVAHNAAFDLAFLTAEYERADVESPPWPVLCTMELARTLSLSSHSSLQACCDAAGVRLVGAHSALGDAEAAAALLTRCLTLAAAQGLDTFADVGCTSVPLLDPPQSSRAQPRLRPRQR